MKKVNWFKFLYCKFIRRFHLFDKFYYNGEVKFVRCTYCDYWGERNE